jgi:hypothetical protein
MKKFSWAAPFLLAIVMTGAEEAKPDGITAHTWVREDVFAGWMAHDNERLLAGERKIDELLKANPQDTAAMGWLHLAQMTRAAWALEERDTAKYEKQITAARATRTKALETNPKDVGMLITVGATLVMAGPRVAEPDRPEMYTLGRKLLTTVREAQAPMIEKLPVHHKGELFSLLAFAADRTSGKADRDKITAEIIAMMPGTPYEARAKKWEQMPVLDGYATVQCLTCHEPGRLKNRLAALNTAK